MFDVQTIGTCGRCGGPVVVPNLWMSVISPTPSCAQCGAVAAQHGLVMEMQPQAPQIAYEYATGSGTLSVSYYADLVYAAVAPFSWGRDES